MRLKNSLVGRIFSLVFAAVFLMAAQGQAAGLRHCPLHDAVPGSGDPAGQLHSSHEGSGEKASHPQKALNPSHVPTSTAGQHSAHGDGHAAQGGHHTKGPGGCMDDCHVGSTVAAEGADRISAPLPNPSARTVLGSPGLPGPRHLSYALHLPNAPPSTIARGISTSPTRDSRCG